MHLTSSAFDNNDTIPIEYTCDGDDISPSLTVSDVPEEAQSLVLTVEDADAPSGSFVHWMVWNINPGIEEIEEGATPEGSVSGANDFGSMGYMGPCPPSGVHHYLFKVRALDKELDLSGSVTKEEIEEEIEGHVIEQATLVGSYGKDEEEAEALEEVG